MTNQELIHEHDQYVMHTYGRFPITISHGEGATLFDFEGKRYIDFSSGIGVNALGYGNNTWAEAIYEQAKKLGHVSNLYYTKPAYQVAKQLCRRTGLSKAFFSNSGAESNEGLIKLARKYSHDTYGEGRSTIVALEGSFHGRTVTTLAATGQSSFHQHFYPFTEGFRHTPADDMDALILACSDDTCAVLIELIQGEGGVLPLEKSFVQELASFCKERDLLLLVDEVQTGIGRTGSLFAFQQYGILPDAVSFAKGIASGVPFGGFLTNEKCSTILGPGTHATTYGGNPLGAAAAIVVLDTLTDEMLADVMQKGEYVQNKVKQWNNPYVKEVRGLGLMVGIILQDISHREVVNKLGELGVLALTAGDATLRLLPPLTISFEEIDAGLEIVYNLLKATA